MPTVSVIMPVYQVAAYVERAARSVLGQTYADLELIAVDDGSTDGSGAVLDALAREDPRLIALHQPNAGAPAARNRALEIARGEYVCFADADDWLEPEMIGSMVSLARAHDLQLVITGFTIDTYGRGGRFVRDVRSQPDEVFATQQAFREAAHRLFDANLLYTPWNKLLRMDYLRAHGLRFPQTFWDDFPFVLSVVRDVERVGVLSGAYYHFLRARSESETARYRPQMYEKREEEHGWMLDLYAHWGLWRPQDAEMVQRRYVERVLGCVENVASPACTLSHEEKLSQVRAMLDNPRVAQALSVARPRSAHMKLLLLAVRGRSARLCLLEGRLPGFARRHGARLYALLKARR